MLPNNNLVSKTLLNNGIDTLTDNTGNFVQAPLPYTMHSLEPYMDAETLYLHYAVHHGEAVKGANDDQQKIKEAVKQKDYELADYWVKKSAYHFSGHVLHSIFWTNLTTKRTEPTGKLLRRLEKHFGSFDQFKLLISTASKQLLGNGWVILAYQPFGDNLVVLQCENQERLTHWGYVPLLAIDVWEHSYYLKYKNQRNQFVDALMQIINWDNVADRLHAALNLKRCLVMEMN